jgi:hypothetical protein
MRTRIRSTTLLAILLLATGVAACGSHKDGFLPTPTAAHTNPAQASNPVSVSNPAPVVDSSPATQDPPLSTPDYKVVAAQLYQARASIEKNMTILAQESAPAAMRVAQINNTILPDLQQLLTAAEAAQPADTTVADLHRHLLNSLQLTIAAYHDFATGLAQNDSIALTRGRAELTAEAQELAIWVHGVPEL